MWPEPSPTLELLNKIAAGDREAINALLERHRAALRRLVELRLDHRLTQRVDASDVVQDVFLEAHGRLEDYLRSPQLPFHLWLRHLAQDRMIDLHRQHHALRRDVSRERVMEAGSAEDASVLNLAAQLVATDLTPAAAALRNEMQQRFLQALTQLGTEDQEILTLRHAEQLANSDVAQVLNLSPAAAGMRYLRALRRLRSLLGTDESLPS